MKTFSLFSPIILVLTLLTWHSAVAQNSIVVSGNPYAPPIVWEEYKKLVGLGPDLVSSILEDLSIPYNTRIYNNWKNVQEKTRAGEIDLVVSAYRNKEREEYLLFSIPYLAQPIVIVVEKGREFRFSSWDVLRDKRGVSNIGESYGQEFDEFIKKNLDVKYFQFERAMQLLNLGEADYLIVDLYTALVYARLLDGEDRITILDPPVATENFHLGIRKNSTLAAKLPDINKYLDAKIKSGQVQELLMMHFENWKKLIDKRSGYFNRDKQQRSESQQAYLKEQDEIARQRIIGTMVNREGLPPAAE